MLEVPQGDKLKEIVEGFETYWGFPQATVAIDGTHIPMMLCSNDMCKHRVLHDSIMY